MRFIAYLILIMATPLAAVTDVKIGDHPTSKLTPYPSILSLHAHGGRVFMGCGTSDDFYPPVIIASYDPATNSFRLEHSAGSDEVTTFRTIGDTLYVAHNDPSHYEDFRDYSYLGPDGVWRDATPAGFLHVYDFAKAGGDLFFCGSRGSFEGSNGIGCLVKSSDDGGSWSVARSGFGDRLYWCLGVGNRLFYQGASLENGVNGPGIPGLTTGTTKTVTLTIDSQPSALILSSGLKVFDGTALTMIEPGAGYFARDGDAVFVVRQDPLTQKSRVYRSAWLGTAGAVWEETPVEVTGPNIVSFAVLGGRAYFGTSDGSLRAANLDGTPLTLPTPAVVNHLPDSFGRGLAASGTMLACGAPDAFSTRAAAGAVEIWQENPGAPAWSLQKQLLPPAPRLCNWYGKDVALLGDVLAIVETGYDLSGKDRGKDARVHVHQNVAGTWVSRSTLSLPYAHSVALLPDFMAVATANPAASQSAGKPGVTPYRITRAANGTVSVTAQTQLAPVTNKWGYKPSSRVVMQGDLLVGGFAGDPSREGSQGMVSIWRRAAGGASFTAAPVQEIPGTGPDRFGYALALDGLWLAIGAPRDDTAALQAGAVHLYRRPSLLAPFTLAQKLVSPVPQAEAQFGSALALRGGTLLCGAPGVAVDGVMRRGAAYVCRLDAAGTWQVDGEMPLPDASLGEFGIEVAMTETWLVAASRLSNNAAPAMDRLSFLPHPEPATLYDAWRQEKGLTASAGNDADADGFSDLVEYVMNLDPRTADSTLTDHAGPAPVFGQPQQSFGGSPPQYTVTWLQRRNDPRLSTVLQFSSDLQTWTPVSLDGATIVFQDAIWTVSRVVVPAAGGGRQFLRQLVTYLRPE